MVKTYLTHVTLNCVGRVPAQASFDHVRKTRRPVANKPLRALVFSVENKDPKIRAQKTASELYCLYKQCQKRDFSSDHA